MAGLWERVKPSTNPDSDSGDDRVSIHLIVAGLKGYAAGIFTKGEILTALNNQLTNNLTSAEQIDLDNIADQIDAQSNTTNKLVYIVGKLEPVMITAESGDIGETKWRNDLGI